MTHISRSERLRRIAEILVVAAVYCVVGRLSLLLAIPPGYATAIWPPAGLALTAALLLGRRIWPGILLGSFLTNVGTTFDVESADALLRSLLLPLAIGTGAALQALAGAGLVRRYTSVPALLDSERGILRLLVLGGPLSCLVNCSISVAALASTGRIGVGAIPFSWWTWWIGDTIGVLVFAPLALLWAPRGSAVPLKRKLWITVPLCCTFAAVVLIFFRASGWERRRIDLESQQRIDSLGHSLTLGLDNSLELLDFFGGLFASSPESGRSDLRRYTQRLLVRHPEIKVLTWYRCVPGAEREGYEQAAARSSSARFEITERGAQGELVRAAERDEYVSLHFIAPSSESERAHGFDAASDPLRAETLSRARDSGKLCATGRIELVPETRDESGVLFVLPFYSGGAVPDGVEERRQRLVGYAAAILRLEGMMNAALEEGERETLGLRLWDLGEDDSEQAVGRKQLLVNREVSDPDRGDPGQAGAHPSAELRVAGHRWALELWPTPIHPVAHTSWKAWSLLAGALLFTGALGTFLLVVTCRTARVEEIAAQRTDELRETNESLQRETAERIVAQRIASIDPLTELLNRRGLEGVLSTEIERARRTGSSLAAILLDLDDFKRINETLGHAVGDIVLKEVSARLRGALRPTDHLARIGGDEFLALLPDTRLAEAAHVAERLRLTVAESPLRLASGPVRLTSSLGLGCVPANVASIEEILTQNHQSLQRSKKAGKNRVSARGARTVLGRESLQDVVEELLRPGTFRAVRHAIHSLSDETIVGWEYLTRGPAGSFEMPNDFFRVALERNVLTSVDLRCLRACLEAAHDLPPEMRCHVNLFPSTLLDTPEERLVELFPHPPRGPRYCVEVSEQQFIGDPACLRGPVSALKEAGIQVAIDDVGFGRSSLESLILLEPDLVKIDQKVVRGAAGDPAKERSLRRLVEVVRATQCEVVAEGIESREDLELLRSVGVPHGQGFLWGQPA